MNDLREGDERPTAYLQFVDGILHQQWEVGYCYENGPKFALGIKTEWRPVESTVSCPHGGQT